MASERVRIRLEVTGPVDQKLAALTQCLAQALVESALRFGVDLGVTSSLETATKIEGAPDGD